MKIAAFFLMIVLITAFLFCSCGVTESTGKVPDDSEASEVMFLVSKKTETVNDDTTATTYEYDDSGMLIKENTDSGSKSLMHEYTYDENGNIVSDHYKSSADEYTTIFYYGENGNIIKQYVKENPGEYLSYEYDAEGRRTKTFAYLNDKLVFEMVYTYSDGKVTVVSEGAKVGKEIGVFDEERKLLLELINDNSHRTIEYDDYGNVVKDVMEKEDGTGYSNEYSYEYSVTGNISKKNGPSGITSYGYDNNGNLLSEITTDGTGEEISRIEYEYISFSKKS